MPISYKHKIYTTLGTPTVLSGDVVSATDSAGVPAKDYTVKGKTIVWNQLLDKSKYPATITRNGVTFTNNGDGTITANGTGGLNGVYYNLVPPAAKPGHKYMLYGCPTGGSSNTYDIVNTIYKSGRYSGSFSDMACSVSMFSGKDEKAGQKYWLYRLWRMQGRDVHKGQKK